LPSKRDAAGLGDEVAALGFARANVAPIATTLGPAALTTIAPFILRDLFTFTVLSPVSIAYLMPVLIAGLRWDIHLGVDQIFSQSRKADKLASSGVARSRVNWANITTSKAPSPLENQRGDKMISKPFVAATAALRGRSIELRACQRGRLHRPHVAGALRGEEQGGFHGQECPLCRDWLRRDVLDSLGRRPFFGDGPVASRDIHDVSAL
jgi:hypothetical protein